MANINYEKAQDSVPQSWIIDCLKLYEVIKCTVNIMEVIKCIVNIMENWRVELTAGRKSLGENPQNDLPGRSAIIIKICNCDDATQ